LLLERLENLFKLPFLDLPWTTSTFLIMPVCEGSRWVYWSGFVMYALFNLF